MAFQLEVIKFRDIVPIQQIPRFVPGLEQPTLEIIGKDFSSVEKVVINDIPSTEVIIVNKRTIWVSLPEGARELISKVEVISSNFTATEAASKVEFEIGDKSRTVSGILKLVQLFSKWMLQTPGSDIHSPERGGGLQEIAGRLLSTKNMKPIAAAIIRSVNTTVDQIQAAQRGINALPLNERLLSAELIDLNVLEAHMEAQARIDIQNVAGTNALTSITL